VIKVTVNPNVYLFKLLPMLEMYSVQCNLLYYMIVHYISLHEFNRDWNDLWHVANI